MFNPVPNYHDEIICYIAEPEFDGHCFRQGKTAKAVTMAAPKPRLLAFAASDW